MSQFGVWSCELEQKQEQRQLRLRLRLRVSPLRQQSAPPPVEMTT
jgi:hypothetical protein